MEWIWSGKTSLKGAYKGPPKTCLQRNHKTTPDVAGPTYSTCCTGCIGLRRYNYITVIFPSHLVNYLTSGRIRIAQTAAAASAA